MGKYILALDQGTSSSRAILFDKQGQVIGIEQIELNQIYPQNGWVEQNPIEIWESQLKAAQLVVTNSKIQPSDIEAIGISNQRETTLIWDKQTGIPVYNAIVWQDKRTSDRCDALINEGLQLKVHEITGLVIDSYFSATKLEWLLKHIVANPNCNIDNLLFGTVDTWLIWQLTNHKVHVTDYTNASRTMLFNINTLQWDDYLVNLFKIPKSILPTVVKSSEIVGYTNLGFGNEVKIPISGIAGDQQAALFGHAGFEPGLAKNTYGTGCFILMNTGANKIVSKNGLICTLTCLTKPNDPKYALEGSVFIGGAAIKWLRDGLKLIDYASETELIAQRLAPKHGVYVVPAFTGLGAPYWEQQAKGAIFGLTLGSSRNHIIKATLESLAYQSKDVIMAMEEDSNQQIKTLNVDGGACVNNYLMQFQSDLLDAQVIRPKNTETTALGAAFLAGLATGFWNGQDDIRDIRKIDRVFSSQMNESQRETLYKGWLKSIKAVMDWAK